MLRRIINRLFLKHRHEIPFLIFFSFLITFILARIISYSVHYNIVPDFLFFVKTVYIQGYHIHHFNFGIILLIIAGFLSLVDSMRSHVRLIAILYGVGLALIVDEFGLLITLNQDAYWGRRSYDAVMVMGLILLNAVYFRSFWRIMGRSIMRAVRRVFPPRE